MNKRVDMRTISRMIDLSDRRALLTGGAGHIGLAAAQALIELGARVAILDREPAACEKRVRELSRVRRGRALPLPCDLSDEKAARGAAREAIRALRGLDILVHCAAYGGSSAMPGWAVPLGQQSVAAWDKALRVNLTAAFVLAQEARRALERSRHGSIILIASIHGLAGPDFSLYAGTPMANPAGYGASKGGLLQLTRYLATALAPRVRVNAISPGGVFRRQPGRFVRRYEARTPLKRMAVEEDIKGAVAYLAGDLSAYVTGHNLVVDGGWTAW